MISDRPLLIPGAKFTDERGELNFVNDFAFAGVKRFYQVTNRRERFVRAWQGHVKGGKYIYAAAGAAFVAAVPLPGDDQPPAQPEQFLLTSADPAILWIPPGYANGWMNLDASSTLFFFSTTTLEENKADDLRFPPDRWSIWEVVISASQRARSAKL